MVAVTGISVLKGILDPREKDRIKKLIDDFGLPVTIPAEYDRETIKKYLLTDKKIIGGKVFYVLPTKIGKVMITDEVEAEMVEKVLE